jgi:hypothetical protein
LKSNKDEKDDNNKPHNKGKASMLYKESEEKLFKTMQDNDYIVYKLQKIFKFDVI